MSNPTPSSSAFGESSSAETMVSSAFAYDKKNQNFQNEIENDEDDDSCCICFEPFTTHDPANITSCKHEYHLQCILEWSQRSKECPICLQDFVLKDPTSQELLAAVEKDRHITLRGISSAVYRDYPLHHLDEDFEDAPYYEEYDHLRRSFVASRGRIISRDSDLFSGLGYSQGSVFPDSGSELDVHLTYPIPSEDAFSEGDSHASGTLSPILIQGPTSIPEPPSNMVSPGSANEEGAFKRRFRFGLSAADSPQRLSSSDAVSFSESLKSKLSAASARYKESISKGTRGFKEKLLARNTSVKELSKGVQREMSAGMAGVARMIERLDLKSKQSAHAVSVSGFTGGTSGITSKGKAVQENVVWPADNSPDEPAYGVKLGTPSCITNNSSSHVDVNYLQRGH